MEENYLLEDIDDGNTDLHVINISSLTSEEEQELANNLLNNGTTKISMLMNENEKTEIKELLTKWNLTVLTEHFLGNTLLKC